MKGFVNAHETSYHQIVGSYYQRALWITLLLLRSITPKTPELHTLWIQVLINDKLRLQCRLQYKSNLHRRTNFCWGSLWLSLLLDSFILFTSCCSMMLRCDWWWWWPQGFMTQLIMGISCSVYLSVLSWKVNCMLNHRCGYKLRARES